MLFEPAPTYTYPDFGWFVEGYPDWRRSVRRVGLANAPQVDEGWRVLQGSGTVTGELFGGCLEVLDWLRGHVRLAGARRVGRPPALHRTVRGEADTAPGRADAPVDRRRSASSMPIAGHPGRAAPRPQRRRSAEAFEATIRRVVAEEFGRPDLPIAANLPFGHTDPQWVLPLGVRAELDLDARTLRLVEPWLS